MRLSFATTLTLVLLAAPARAEVFNTARTLNPGAVSLAAEYQAFGGPLGSLYAGVGVVRRFDLGLRVGFEDGPSPGVRYVGGDAELNLVEDKGSAPAVSLSLGGHGRIGARDVVLDATLLASKLFLERLEPYVGLDVDWSLAEVRGQYRVVGGVEFAVVKRRFDLLVEGALGLDAGTPRTLAAGFCVYL